jgi:hypothetical protein
MFIPTLAVQNNPFGWPSFRRLELGQKAAWGRWLK